MVDLAARMGMAVNGEACQRILWSAVGSTLRRCSATRGQRLKAVSGGIVVLPFGRERLSCERLQQCLGLLQIRRVEPFGEPAVDRRQQRTRFVAFALLLPEATEAHGSAQLE